MENHNDNPMFMIPGPYTAPSQFYAHLGPGREGSVSDPSETPTLSVRKQADSTAPSSPPPKRPRGRPRGSTNRASGISTAPKATKASKPKAAPKSKTRPAAAPTSPEASKENIPPVVAPNLPPPVYELSDDDDDDVKGDGGKRWPDPERGRFFDFLLADTPEGDKRFKQHQTNPGHVYSRASTILYNSLRSAASIKAMYGRAIDTFTWMSAFNDFTGNGGGDADYDDPEAILKSKLKAACASGQHLGSLKPATITEREDRGWYELFWSRLGTSSKVARTVVRSSASALSDLDNDSDIEHSSDANIDPALREQSRTTPASQVSEPKHVPSSSLRKQANVSFSSMGDLVKMKMKSEENKANALEAKLAIEREKLDLEKARVELDKAKGKVEMARMVLEMNGVDDEVKGAANEFLKTLFS
ncbi:hypothetical protein DFH08DRAFT_940180 [Mycena albidolilacea]|uniref:Uncharacterized protein n=1 Tax=Mycena albidolilacea TaxID=1033008 RepID=A0AAD6ZN85_9AGAR|nr:hypothetical protein DFH08DRAFT_940180 [Mycena albidolilacea]